MPFTPEQLLDRLATLGIAAKTHRHPALFTVEQSKILRGDLPGAHCKNLFLKDKKGALWLVVVLADREIDLKKLRHHIGAAHLSFGKAELLQEVLGVQPGSVTPFALINDHKCQVNVVLDAEMLAMEPVNYHPLTNEATTTLTSNDLLRFIESCGHSPQIVTF